MPRHALLIGTAAWGLLAVSGDQAHEMRPAYLEVKETGPGKYTWRASLSKRVPVLRVTDG